MSQLALHLLGPSQIYLRGQSLKVSRRKAVALLAYLALEQRLHSRDVLADFLWPGYDQSYARKNLTNTLSSLTQALAGNWIERDRTTVRLLPGDHLWVDVEAFEDLLADRSQHDHPTTDVCPRCIPPLKQAVELYQADFLSGFSLRDSPEFEQWQAHKTRTLRVQLALAFEKLSQALVYQGDFEAAIAYIRQSLVKIGPWHEPGHRRLMQLYAWTGRRQAALRQYDECVRQLQEALAQPPEQVTTDLYESIKGKRFPLESDGAPSIASPNFGSDDQVREKARVKPEWAKVRDRSSQLPPFLKQGDSEVEGPIFVGREPELTRLNDFLDKALAGQVQIVFVTGEAGLGKTSLVTEFARQAVASHMNLVVAQGTCIVYTGVGDPYLPFREIIRMLTADVEGRLAGGSISREAALRLWNLLPQSVPALLEQGPELIDTFISGDSLELRATAFGLEDADWLARLREQLKQNEEGNEKPDQGRLFEAYTNVLRSLAAERPMLLILDDLHWADLSSIGLLAHLGQRIGGSPIMLVGTYRPEDVSQGRAGEPHPLTDILAEFKRSLGEIWIDLATEDAAEKRAFVDAWLDSEPNRLGEDFRQDLTRHTGGHPLFVVELLRDLQERGDITRDEAGQWVEGPALIWDAVPARVEGVIEKRIGRLDDELREALIVASVEGEEFTAEVVARVLKVEERSLVRRMSAEVDKQHRLVDGIGIQHMHQQRLSRYRFHHNLFQKYLYSSLDEMERSYLHEDVGTVLEALYGDQTDTHAIQLARHFQSAGQVSKAINYLQKAGDAAANVYANVEAVAHYSTAVELAKQIDLSTEELAYLYLRLGDLLLVTKGDAALEVGQAYERAFDLYQQVGETPQRFAALRGLAMFHKLRGESGAARKLTEQMTILAYDLQDPALIVEACFAMGSLLFYSGEFEPAQTYLEQGIDSYDLQQHQSLILMYNQDPGVANLCYAAWNLWLLGYPDRALERCSEALALAQSLSHPYSLTMAQIWAGWVHRFRREAQVVREHSEAAISLSAKHDFTLFNFVGMLQRGWALAEQGEVEEGISQMQQSLSTATLSQGMESAPPHHLAPLAEIYGKVGQPETGLDIINKAQTVMKQEWRWFFMEAELYRLKGELLLLCGEPEADVEANFQQAISIARQQEAKSLELRAAISLARLWQSQEKQKEAYKLLTEIYDSITEGFDTVDLKEAKALLEDLSGIVRWPKNR